ncbi:hypothetical protein C791_8231 [Amycolatopsis azurea DSM 43854]|uniref:Uncharacterized protein n=1 Tax=Amycolatopsis azurea DSM 43854 TaxID=1238180 RepID=M2Q7F2_9PSEU|nr:hypothetical protein C791_8231 [Amycolatopsis azurea DSM 43854]
MTVTVSPPEPVKTTTSARKSPWRCEPGYPNCTKAQSQKCRLDPEKIWDTDTQKCRYKTSGETQREYFNRTPRPGTP